MYGCRTAIASGRLPRTHARAGCPVRRAVTDNGCRGCLVWHIADGGKGHASAAKPRKVKPAVRCARRGRSPAHQQGRRRGGLNMRGLTRRACSLRPRCRGNAAWCLGCGWRLAGVAVGWCLLSCSALAFELMCWRLGRRQWVCPVLHNVLKTLWTERLRIWAKTACPAQRHSVRQRRWSALYVNVF